MIEDMSVIQNDQTQFMNQTEDLGLFDDPSPAAV